MAARTQVVIEADAELEALKTCVEALRPLSDEEVERIMSYLSSRFGISVNRNDE